MKTQATIGIGIVVLVAALGAWLLSHETVTPAALAKVTDQPADQPSGTPIAPAAPAAAGQKQEFPGPRGTKITFPTGLYDEKADPVAMIRAAREKAKADNRRILVMWGENMCGFCVFLNDVIMNDPLVAPLVKSEFVVIKINIGKSFQENLAVQNAYGVDFFAATSDGKGVGAPGISVIDPVLDRGAGFIGGNAMVAKPMTMERTFDEKVIYEFLTNAKAPAKPAMAELTGAQTAAGKDKKVLAFFTMPLCESCDVAAAWLARADVQSVLKKGFAIARIDTERMIGGQDVLSRTAGTKAVMAPFMIFLTPDGTAVTESGKFTALPKTDDQINGFIDSLRKAYPGLSDGDKEVLVKSLKAAWEPKVEEKK